MRHRANPATSARPPTLPATDRRCPSPTDHPDRSGSAHHQVPPIASPKTPDTHCTRDPADETPVASTSDSSKTSEYESLPIDCEPNTPDSPALQTPAPVACNYSSSERQTRRSRQRALTNHRCSDAPFPTEIGRAS